MNCLLVYLYQLTSKQQAARHKAKTMSNKRELNWSFHTVNFLREIGINPTLSVIRQPINIFGQILHEVATRASELNDPKLNALMVRLTLYEIADPESPEYNKALCDQILDSAQ